MKKLNRKLNRFLPGKIIGFLKWVGSHSPRSLRGAANYVLRFALLVRIFLKPNLRQNELLMDLASAAPYRKSCDVTQSIPSEPAEKELK
jgi:hypothetical protein